jgi:hypothetical protein
MSRPPLNPTGPMTAAERVPREREAIYTFNPHFNFFPYPHSLLRGLIPLDYPFDCEDIGRDLYFVETRGE